ncbi:phosphatidic acid phosphatase type 2/haloperoxidase [Mrakia frigida]|uniref:phosphatase PAP2 family protein n=1 Tax=Mrakia frigida TaxID=29902 RepID=UPI003FCC2622
MRLPKFFSDQGSAKPMTRKRKWLLVRTYLPDWIITIVLWGLFYLLDRINGFRRTFDINDTSLHHTFAVHERVPPYALFLICLLFPVVVILIVSLGVLRSAWDLHSGLLGLILSLAVTSTATNIIKICVGRPRPDLLDRCQPAAGLSNPTPYTLSSSSICTRTDLLNDGFRSFPSGHASLSFCGLIYLTFYLAAKMKISNKRGLSIKTWILLAPISGAVLVAVSRSMDYRHHATDIIAGSILGFFIGWYCYRQYYPPLSHPLCHRPYSPRVPREDEDADAEGGRELAGLAANGQRNGNGNGMSKVVTDEENGVDGGGFGRSTIAEDGRGADGGVGLVDGVPVAEGR